MRDRLLKSLRLVVRPREIEAFRSLGSGEDLEELWKTNRPCVLAEMSHLAYHSRETIEFCLRRLGASSVWFIDRNGAQAFVAGWEECIILSFRGTGLDKTNKIDSGFLKVMKDKFESVFGVTLPSEYQQLLANDVLADANIFKRDVGEARVHSGFLGEFRKLWGGIEMQLDVLCEECPRPISATGHSLGGAMAVIAAMHRDLDEVVTFGQPRVGRGIDREFRASRHLRFVNGNDPVPLLPPAWLGYEHRGEEVKIADPVGANVIYDHAIPLYAEVLALGGSSA